MATEMLTNRDIILDPEFEYLRSACSLTHKINYTTARVGSRLLSYVVWKLVNGDAIPERVIDHINRNPLDNRITNLRLCTPVQNSANTRSHRDSVSRFKGVSFDTKNQSWRARIVGVQIGQYQTEVEAAWAYNIAAKEWHGQYAVLNDITCADIDEVLNAHIRLSPASHGLRPEPTK